MRCGLATRDDYYGRLERKRPPARPRTTPAPLDVYRTEELAR